MRSKEPQTHTTTIDAQLSDGRVDAAVPDATAPDATVPDAQPQLTLIDTVTIEVDGTVVDSVAVLQAGQTYLLRVSGVFQITSAGALSDAEYWDNAGTFSDTVSGIDVGVAINDTVVDGNKTPHWGAYNASHIYEVNFVGTGAVIATMVHDGNLTNNVGNLTLEIYSQ